MKLKTLAGLLAIAGIAAPGMSFATNGMNMEGYGPIATGMGGASFAYDNGSAAMMNNPATIGLMSDGDQRLDVAVGELGPKVKTSHATFGTANSTGDSYVMPAVGYVRKDGKISLGFGVFAQGGMGTEYGTNSFVSLGTGKEVRSEVGVGRAMIPFAFDVSDNLVVGGSVDYVWAGMDLKMAMDGATMAGMMGMGPASTVGTITTTGSLAANLMAAGFTGAATDVGYFNFSNDNKFTGDAKATGYAGKIGFAYKVNPKLTVGGTYHSKTELGDLETGNNAQMLLYVGGAEVANVSGKIKVVNFQWPETYGLGLSYQATDKLMVAADYKRINWAKVMKNFNMKFETAAGDMNVTMFQNWADQDVYQLGVAYKATEALTLRAGASFSKNPIPDSTLNYLFPAIEKDHYTLGAGFAVSKVSSVDFSLTVAPNVSQTNSNTGMKSEMKQTNWQLMYSHRF